MMYNMGVNLEYTEEKSMVATCTCTCMYLSGRLWRGDTMRTLVMTWYSVESHRATRSAATWLGRREMRWVGRPCQKCSRNASTLEGERRGEEGGGREGGGREGGREGESERNINKLYRISSDVSYMYMYMYTCIHVGSNHYTHVHVYRHSIFRHVN